MSAKFNRREWLKLGALGGGIGAYAGVVGGLGTLADVGAGGPGLARPFWVRRVPKPTMGIDDATYHSFNGSNHVLYGFRKYFGEEKTQAVFKQAKELMQSRMKQKKPGYRIEDKVLMDASWTAYNRGGLNEGLRSWTKLDVSTPAEMGVAPFSETPQRAALVVKRAARYFGAATVGITALDRRHVFSHEQGHQIVFEPVDEPYAVKDEKLVIPEKCNRAIAVSIQMSLDTVQCAPTCLAGAGSSLAYSRAAMLVGSLAEFIRGLGYTAIPSVNDVGSSVAIAVDAGLGELGRTNRLITPEFGPMVRLAKVITDLPLATDSPIDFGLKEFCTVCKKCAEACPSKSLSKEDHPSFAVAGEWNNPGHEAWFEKSIRCFEYWNQIGSDCGVCLVVCPWSKKDKTAIHEMVKASGAKMPFLSGVFTEMDTLFGYGKRSDPNLWWHLDLPEYGINGGA